MFVLLCRAAVPSSLVNKAHKYHKMQFKNQLICAAVYIFATLLAACTALPINVTSLGESFHFIYIHKHTFIYFMPFKQLKAYIGMEGEREKDSPKHVTCPNYSLIRRSFRCQFRSDLCFRTFFSAQCLDRCSIHIHSFILCVHF